MRTTKKQLIINYFSNLEFMVSKNILRKKFNISQSYLNKILKLLIKNKFIECDNSTKIKYYTSFNIKKDKEKSLLQNDRTKE